jgi:membrane-anchored protein YejM (alkaline phosphatase superfamily)
MKKLSILIIILLYGLKSSAYTLSADSAIHQPIEITSLDSLKQQLQLAGNDTLKSAIYSQIVTEYLNYDKISDSRIKRLYQNQALNYTYR